MLDALGFPLVRWTLGLGVLVGVALAPAQAAAYCRTYTCQADSNCTMDALNCPVGGKPLYWPRRCISFSVQQDGSSLQGIAAADAERVLEASYATWTTTQCGDGLGPSIEVFKLGRTSCGAIEFNECDENANVWVFRDQVWPYDDGGRTLAQTWVHFDTRTGEIYDADVEVNTAQHLISTGNAADRSQFIAIATHEIGHVLGLDHSQYEDATMYTYYSTESNLSVLTQDDIDGLCTIYPSTRAVGDCDPEPYNGFSASCGSVECDDGCCTTAPGRSERGAAWAALLGALGLVGAQARRRARPRLTD